MNERCTNNKKSVYPTRGLFNRLTLGRLGLTLGLRGFLAEIFPDFSGFPDFHTCKLSLKKSILSIKNWKDLASYCGFNYEDVASAIN